MEALNDDGKTFNGNVEVLKGDEEELKGDTEALNGVWLFPPGLVLQVTGSNILYKE